MSIERNTETGEERKRMRDAAQLILDTLKKVYPTGFYCYFTAAAVLFLLFRRRRKPEGTAAALHALIVLIIIVLPPTAYILRTYLRDGIVYWRLLWMVPYMILIAYASVEAADLLKSRGPRIAAVTGLMLLLALGGRNLYRTGPFTRAENREKLPAFTLTCASVIEENARATGNSYKRLAGPVSITSEIREIDPSILQCYGRVFNSETLDPDDAWGYFIRVMYGNLDDSKNYLTRFLNYQGCNYAVLASGRHMDEGMEAGGFSKIYDEGGWQIWYNADTENLLRAGEYDGIETDDAFFIG